MIASSCFIACLTMLIGSFFLIYERWIRGGVVGQDGGRVVRLVRLVIRFVRLGFALVFVSVCVFLEW